MVQENREHGGLVIDAPISRVGDVEYSLVFAGDLIRGRLELRDGQRIQGELVLEMLVDDQLRLEIREEGEQD